MILIPLILGGKGNQLLREAHPYASSISLLMLSLLTYHMQIYTNLCVEKSLADFADGADFLQLNQSKSCNESQQLVRVKS
ncbi:hypothetical protein [uncultured Chryseobacterium sp.]|uniref:hypothetical protein n=1 Tax=uncultured Chryseobacterium sp. TaxID=259322 RepID=UPI0025F8CB85|nr:hypothetical protein [uncultured Chryseobacterium sp.]